MDESASNSESKRNLGEPYTLVRNDRFSKIKVDCAIKNAIKNSMILIIIKCRNSI